MVLSIDFYRVLRSQTVSKGQPALAPLVSQILRKIKNFIGPPRTGPAPTGSWKIRERMFGTGCDFEDNNEEEDKGAFPECSLEMAARRAPSHSTLCCPSACAHVHVHTCMHTHTHTHTHRLRPSICPGVWDSVTGEAGWWLRWRSWVQLDTWQGVWGASPGSSVGRSYSPLSCKRGAPCASGGGGLGDAPLPWEESASLLCVRSQPPNWPALALWLQMDSCKIWAGFQESGPEETWGLGSHLYMMPEPGSSCLPRVVSLLVQHAGPGASSRPWPVVLPPGVGPGWAVAGVWGGEMEEGEATSSART